MNAAIRKQDPMNHLVNEQQLYNFRHSSLSQPMYTQHHKYCFDGPRAYRNATWKLR